MRVYLLQQWHGLADEAIEDALYDSQALRGFARIDLMAEGVPDAATLLKFRRLLETNGLCKGLFAAISLRLATGASFDANPLQDSGYLIASPASREALRLTE